jgi:hypothetical protein
MMKEWMNVISAGVCWVEDKAPAAAWQQLCGLAAVTALV